MRPLTLLCLVQSLLLVGLAVAWFVGGEDGAVARPTAVPGASSESAGAGRLPPRRDGAVAVDSADADAASRRPVGPGEDGVEEPPAAGDPVGRIVFGRITGPDGVWIPYASVQLQDGEGDRRQVRQLDERGYAIAGLRPGVHRLTVYADGFLSHTDELEVRSDLPRQRFDLVLDKQRQIEVRLLTPDGRTWGEVQRARRREELAELPRPSVQPAQQVCEPGAPAPVPDQRLGHWHGKHNAGSGPFGTLRLGAEPVSHVLLVYGSTVLLCQELEPAAERVEFTIDPDAVSALRARLRVRVTDARRVPLEGATVFMDWDDKFRTDRDGVVLFEGEQPGRRQVRLEADGFESRWTRVDLAPGERTDLEVSLADRRVLRGRVHWPAGHAEAWRAVVVLPVSEAEREPRYWADPQGYYDVASDGTFECPGLGARRYVVRVSAEGLAPAFTVVDLRGGDEPPVLDLHLTEGHRVEVRAAEDASADVFLVFARPDGVPVWSWQVRGRKTEVVLAAGSYVLSVDHGRGPVDRRTVQVGPGENVFTWQ